MLVLVTVIASCGLDPRASDEPNTAYMYLNEEIRGLGPVYAQDAISGACCLQIFDSLYEYEYLVRPYELKPCLAAALPEVSPDADATTLAYERDPGSLGRPWITPGMPGLVHRTGGLEKDYLTGHISYDPDNHQRMTEFRQAKVDSVADFIPDQLVELGDDSGDIVVVGWGSTYGPIYQAVRRTGASFVHLRHIHPLPRNLGALLGRFDTVLVPEMNTGQLATLLRDMLGIEPVSFDKVSGQPFRISELADRIEAERNGDAS